MYLLHPQRSNADLAKDGSEAVHDKVNKGRCRNFPESYLNVLSMGIIPKFH